MCGYGYLEVIIHHFNTFAFIVIHIMERENYILGMRKKRKTRNQCEHIIIPISIHPMMGVLGWWNHFITVFAIIVQQLKQKQGRLPILKQLSNALLYCVWILSTRSLLVHSACIKVLGLCELGGISCGICENLFPYLSLTGALIKAWLILDYQTCNLRQLLNA